MKTPFFSGTPLIVALFAIALGSRTTRADQIVYVTPPGSTTSGPVNAEADFTTANGFLTITLKNLQANPGDVAQLISDFSFTVGNGGSLVGSSLTGAMGQELTVNGNKTFSTGPTLTTPAMVGWVYSNPNPNPSTTGLLDVLAGAGHAGPSHLIIGPPGGPTYSNANGSIAGNGPHNPFLNQSATFTITAPSLTSLTTITSATFSFGTTAGLDIDGRLGSPAPPDTVPEPATVVMGVIAGLFGLIGFGRRKKATT